MDNQTITDELDEISRRCLRLVADSGPLDSGTLKRTLNYSGGEDLVNQTRQINYRFEKYLIPMGLAVEVEPESPDGGGKPPRRYNATTVGKRWHEETDEKLPLKQIVADLQARVDRHTEELQSKVDDLEERVKSNSGLYGGIQSQQSDINDRMEAIEDTVDQIEEKLSEKSAELTSAQQRTGAHSNRIGTLEKRVDELEDEINRVESKVEEYTDLAGEIENWADEFEDEVHGQLEQQDSVSQDLHRRVRELENTQEEIKGSNSWLG